jgi:peptide deformylase
VVRQVLRYPDPRLKTPAVAVRRVGPAARRLAEDLRDTARAHPRTVGLAAPQLGAPWRMIWIDCTGHPRVPEPLGPMWLVDPRVVEREGSAVGREGCLSLPEITARVRRASQVAVRARDLDGREHLLRAEGFEARVLQHEIDHLDGILILDRVASLLLDVFPRRGDAGPDETVRRARTAAIGQSPPP